MDGMEYGLFGPARIAQLEQYDSNFDGMEYGFFGPKRIAQLERENLDRYHRSILRTPSYCAYRDDRKRSTAVEDANMDQEAINEVPLQFREETKSEMAEMMSNMAEMKAQMSVIISILHDTVYGKEATPITPTLRAANEIDDLAGRFPTKIHGSYIDSDSVQEESIQSLEKIIVEPSAHNMFDEMPSPLPIELMVEDVCSVLGKMTAQNNARKVVAEMPEPILEENLVSIEAVNVVHSLLDNSPTLSQVNADGDFNGKKDSLPPYPYIIEGDSSVNGSSWVSGLFIGSSKVSTPNSNYMDDVLSARLGCNAQVFDPGTLALFKQEDYECQLNAHESRLLYINSVLFQVASSSRNETNLNHDLDYYQGSEITAENLDEVLVENEVFNSEEMPELEDYVGSESEIKRSLIDDDYKLSKFPVSKGIKSCEYSVVCLPNALGYKAIVIASLELDVYLCVDAMLMIIFDPGGVKQYWDKMPSTSFAECCLRKAFKLLLDPSGLNALHCATDELCRTDLCSRHKNNQEYSALGECKNVLYFTGYDALFLFDPGEKYSLLRAWNWTGDFEDRKEQQGHNMILEQPLISSFNYDALGDAYMHICVFLYEHDLMFQAVYQRSLHLFYIYDFLPLVQQYVISFYILEDKDVLKRVGNRILVMVMIRRIRDSQIKIRMICIEEGFGSMTTWRNETTCTPTIFIFHDDVGINKGLRLPVAAFFKYLDYDGLASEVSSTKFLAKLKLELNIIFWLDVISMFGFYPGTGANKGQWNAYKGHVNVLRIVAVSFGIIDHLFRRRPFDPGGCLFPQFGCDHFELYMICLEVILRLEEHLLNKNKMFWRYVNLTDLLPWSSVASLIQSIVCHASEHVEDMNCGVKFLNESEHEDILILLLTEPCKASRRLGVLMLPNICGDVLDALNLRKLKTLEDAYEGYQKAKQRGIVIQTYHITVQDWMHTYYLSIGEPCYVPFTPISSCLVECSKDAVTDITPLYFDDEAWLVVRNGNYGMPWSLPNCSKATFFCLELRCNAALFTNAAQGAAISNIFIWDPGVCHITTLRTRRLLRGRICHDPRVKSDKYKLLSITDVI